VLRAVSVETSYTSIVHLKRASLVAVLAAWPVSASSLRGSVKDEYFGVVPNASVMLVSEDSAGTVRQTVTNGEGAFVFSQARAGSYTLRVQAAPFKAFVQKGIRIAEEQDYQLRRVLLAVGESGGNCTPMMQTRFTVQKAEGVDVEIAGAIVNGSPVRVNVLILGDDRRSEYATTTDERGLFRFRAPVSGDVRLKIEGVEHTPSAAKPGVIRFDANVTTTSPGDRVTIEPIRPPFPKLDHWCY
jgi:hypothetical protein